MSDALIWSVIVLLGIGTYLIRFSFIGLIGGRELPGWIVRCLRFVPVAVMPAIATPLVIWPEATGGTTDPARVLAAAAVLAVGVGTRSVMAAIAAGIVTLYGVMALL